MGKSKKEAQISIRHISIAVGRVMSADAQEEKRRFDDAYRALMVIGGILSFAFNNYENPLAQYFVYYIGFPFLISSVFLWVIPHLVLRKWEYDIKFIGFVLIWFASFGLFFIVYFKQATGPGAILINTVVTVIVTYVVGIKLRNTKVVSARYAILMTIFAILLALLSLPFIGIG